MQKYALFKYAPNLNHSFFELFLRIEAKVLSYKDVVEHIFSDTGGKAERGTPYYIHTRVRRARTRAYAQGKGRGNTGKVRKMHKGNQNGNPKKRKKGRRKRGLKD